jgi:thiamine monophosphate synthase
VLAIGGVTADRVREIRPPGRQAAVIRAILGADDAARATRGLLRMLA